MKRKSCESSKINTKNLYCVTKYVQILLESLLTSKFIPTPLLLYLTYSPLLQVSPKWLRYFLGENPIFLSGNLLKYTAQHLTISHRSGSNCHIDILHKTAPNNANEDICLHTYIYVSIDQYMHTVQTGVGIDTFKSNRALLSSVSYLINLSFRYF